MQNTYIISHRYSVIIATILFTLLFIFLNSSTILVPHCINWSLFFLLISNTSLEKLLELYNKCIHLTVLQIFALLLNIDIT